MTELLPVPVAPADLSLSLDHASAYAGAARSTRRAVHRNLHWNLY